MNSKILVERNDSKVISDAMKAYHKFIKIVKNNIYKIHKNIISQTRKGKTESELRDIYHRGEIPNVFDVKDEFDFAVNFTPGPEGTASYKIGVPSYLYGKDEVITIHAKRPFEYADELYRAAHGYKDSLYPWRSGKGSLKNREKFYLAANKLLKELKNPELRKIFIHEYVHHFDHYRMKKGSFLKILDVHKKRMEDKQIEIQKKWRGKWKSGGIELDTATISANNEYRIFKFKEYISMSIEANARFIENLQRGDFIFKDKLRRGKTKVSFSEFLKEFINAMRRPELQEMDQLWEVFPPEIKKRMLKRLWTYYDSKFNSP
jgi:hypothetical protein